MCLWKTLSGLKVEFLNDYSCCQKTPAMENLKSAGPVAFFAALLNITGYCDSR